MNDETEALQRAKDLGLAAGIDAARHEALCGNKWKWEEWKARTLAAIVNDEEHSLNFQRPNLSGEWTDELTPNQLYEQCIGPDWNEPAATSTAAMVINALDMAELQERICTTWEMAVEDAFWSELKKICEEGVIE